MAHKQANPRTVRVVLPLNLILFDAVNKINFLTGLIAENGGEQDWQLFSNGRDALENTPKILCPNRQFTVLDFGNRSFNNLKPSF